MLVCHKYTINQRFGYCLGKTNVVDEQVYVTMYREIMVQEAKSDKTWKPFAAGNATRINIRDSFIDDIILEATKEAYKRVLINARDNKALQNMYDPQRQVDSQIHDS